MVPYAAVFVRDRAAVAAMASASSLAATHQRTVSAGRDARSRNQATAASPSSCSGAGEIRAIESGAREQSSIEISLDQPGTLQIGFAQIPLAEVCLRPVDKAGPAEPISSRSPSAPFVASQVSCRAMYSSRAARCCLSLTDTTAPAQRRLGAFE